MTKDGPTGIEAAKIVSEYLELRLPTLDEGDAANIIHILHEAGVRFRVPAAPPKPAPDAVREAVQSVIDEMIVVATQKDDSNIPEWTSENQAEIDKWQVRLADAIAAPVPSPDGAGNPSAPCFKASHPPRMATKGERDPSVMPDCHGAETSALPGSKCRHGNSNWRMCHLCNPD